MKNSGGAPFLYLCYWRWVLWPVVGTTQQLLGIICRSWHGVEAIPGDGLRKDVEGRWSLRISWYGNIADIEVGVLKGMIPVTLEFICWIRQSLRREYLWPVVWGAFGKLGHGNRLAQSTPKVVVALQGATELMAALKSNSTLVNCRWYS